MPQSFAISVKCTNFALAKQKTTGALDEWLSHWSAKPVTPVRIGYAPHEKMNIN